MQTGQSARPQYMQTATASAVLWRRHFIHFKRTVHKPADFL
jgi:hypothetical protein